MTYQQVMDELAHMGTAQNRKIYQRHGSGENLFGVSFANLKILKKNIKIDHQLALQLWASKNTDARTLAIMIADPKSTDDQLLDEWLADMQYYMLVDTLVSHLASKSPFARKKMEQWTKSDDEWISSAGWQLLAQLAMTDETFTDEYLESYIKEITSRIHTAKNRTKYAMNNALIAIGSRNSALKEKSLVAAGQIGAVDVDHGDTSCKTPDAATYIEKVWVKKKR